MQGLIQRIQHRAGVSRPLRPPPKADLVASRCTDMATDRMPDSPATLPVSGGPHLCHAHNALQPIRTHPNPYGVPRWPSHPFPRRAAGSALSADHRLRNDPHGRDGSSLAIPHPDFDGTIGGTERALPASPRSNPTERFSERGRPARLRSHGYVRVRHARSAYRSYVLPIKRIEEISDFGRARDLVLLYFRKDFFSVPSEIFEYGPLHAQNIHKASYCANFGNSLD